jgi:hypothetical protein
MPAAPVASARGAVEQSRQPAAIRAMPMPMDPPQAAGSGHSLGGGSGGGGRVCEAGASGQDRLPDEMWTEIFQRVCRAAYTPPQSTAADVEMARTVCHLAGSCRKFRALVAGQGLLRLIGQSRWPRLARDAPQRQRAVGGEGDSFEWGDFVCTQLRITARLDEPSPAYFHGEGAASASATAAAQHQRLRQLSRGDTDSSDPMHEPVHRSSSPPAERLRRCAGWEAGPAPALRKIGWVEADGAGDDGAEARLGWAHEEWVTCDILWRLACCERPPTPRRFFTAVALRWLWLAVCASVCELF